MNFNKVNDFLLYWIRLVVIWGFMSHSFFSLIWRPNHYRCNFYIYLVHITIVQWRFFSVPRLMRHGNLFIMVISEDTWHSHLYCWLFYDLGLSRLGFEHPTFSLRSTATMKLSREYVMQWKLMTRERARTTNSEIGPVPCQNCETWNCLVFVT